MCLQPCHGSSTYTATAEQNSGIRGCSKYMMKESGASGMEILELIGKSKETQRHRDTETERSDISINVNHHMNR